MRFSGNMCSMNDLGNMLSRTLLKTNHHTDTTLRLGSLDSSSLDASGANMNKRKRSVDGIEYPENDVTLVLGLGRPPSSPESSKYSSATGLTVLSGKECEEGSTNNPSLDFQLHLGTETTEDTSSRKMSTMSTAHKSETGAVCDLELSLSGPSTSVITNVSPLSFNMNNLDISVSVNGVSPIDEGSTSSRWKPGVSLLPPYQGNQSVHSLTVNWSDSSIIDSFPSMPSHISTAVQAPKNLTNSSSGTNHSKLPRNIIIRTCQFQGCAKGARGASGLCIAHGGGRRCQKPGCHKGAEGRTPFCKAHGGGRRCQSLGCTKSAEGRTSFCIAHGGGRRCSHDGCTRAARGKSGLCIRHGGGKRCQKENCTKSAEGYSGLCISHGGGRRCQFPACTKGAQGSTMYCKAHGGGKRCTAPGCTKGAEGSTPFCKGHGGGKRCSFQGGGICPKSVHGGTQFCVAHGGGKRCAAPECTKSARGRTDFCVRHGGGKRCRSEGCGKSAQGKTDFCKAHGGGKRCSWGQAETSGFARGKTGLSTTHSSSSSLVHDPVVHGGDYLVHENAAENSNSSASMGSQGWNFTSHQVRPDLMSLPEGECMVEV